MINPSLQYHHQAPVFFLDRVTLQGFFGQPGSLLSCLAAGISQFYVIGWMGALFTTAAAWWICRSTQALLRSSACARVVDQHPLRGPEEPPAAGESESRKASSRRGSERCLEIQSAHLLPAMLLLAAQSDYAFPIVPVLLGLCLSLGGAVLDRQFRSFRLGWRWSAFALILILLAWLVQGFCLVFVGVTLALETSRLWRPWLQRVTRRPLFQGLRRHAVICIGLAVAGYVAMTFDRQQKLLIEIDLMARQGRWARVIDLAGELHKTTPAAAMDISRALFHLGRLPVDQFSPSLPQPLVLLPLTDAQLQGGGLALVDVLLDLGQVNPAEHGAYETLELQGERLETLKCLARIHELKHQPAAAQIYRNRLHKNPAFRWLMAHPVPSDASSGDGNTPGTAAYESFRLQKDYPGTLMQPDFLLFPLLQANIKNRMAFEYLMGFYLQTRQLDRATQLLQRIDELDYSPIPRTYQEALALFHAVSPSAQTNAPEPGVLPNVSKRLADFLAEYQQLNPGDGTGRRRLEQEWGDTYWAYYFLSDRGASASISATDNYQ
ncbi:MAG: hypothetical protein H7A46_15850 [Verrucomicrobiales bacterium]|nr:hypothetical protein [Verrucomicrobiales bacterium]